MKFLNGIKTKDDENYAVENHTHKTTDITNFISSVQNIVLTGLSTASNSVISVTDTILSALGKLQSQISSHQDNDSNPHSVTKEQINLGNVDNTSDSNKNVLSASKLTTPQTITIGNVGKSFDGSDSISFTVLEIGAVSNEILTATIPITGWSDTAPYTIAISVPGLTNSSPNIGPVYSTDPDIGSNEIEAWNVINNGYIDCTTNTMTIVCYEEIPTTVLNVQILGG